MPTYAYACRDCHHAFEIVQSFSDPSLTLCPECGGNLRKVYNSVGVVFKGSGFYRTDSRSSSSATAPAGSEAAKDGKESEKPEKSDKKDKLDKPKKDKKDKAGSASSTGSTAAS